MNIQWHLIFVHAWPIFWITTLYSYCVCSVIGTLAKIKTKDSAKMQEALDKFVISPFYVATFFSLFSVLLFSNVHMFESMTIFCMFCHVILVGLTVFVWHFMVELVESIVVSRNIRHIFEDRDALILSGIYLLIIAMVGVIVILSK